MRTVSTVLVAAIVVGGMWAAVAWLPMFSESYTALALVRGFDGPLAAFDPSLVPFRPLQHLAFWLFDRIGADPAVGRAVTFGLHGVSSLLVFAIAQRLGASRRGAWLAFALFLAFPTTKGLVWLAAISGPVRTCCLLTIVWATIVWVQRPSAALGALIAGVFAVALGIHQSSVLAVPIVGLGILCLAPGTLAARLCAALRALRCVPLLLALLLAVGFALYVGTLQDRSYHGIAQRGAIVANVARAALAFVPEWVRLPALEGLRSPSGSGGFVAALAVVAAIGIAWLGLLWRSTSATRWLLVLIPLDLLLPVLTTGFVSRYAMFAAALLSIVLALQVERGAVGVVASRWRLAACWLVVVAWGIDHVVDLVEVRAAGRTMERLLDDAAKARTAAPPGRRIALIDAPDHAGGDDDVPVCNWGLGEALAARGIPGPWLLLRVDPCWTTSDHRRVSEQELAALAADPELETLRFDPSAGGFVAWRPR